MSICLELCGLGVYDGCDPTRFRQEVGLFLLGNNHAVLGASGGFVAGTVVEAPIGVRLVMTGVGAIGGLLPDIDTQSSRLGRFLPKFWHKLTPGHRCFTHSLLYMALAYAVAYLVLDWGISHDWWEAAPKPYMPIALVAGMFSHLFADSITKQGVPWFYPLSRRKIRTLGPLSFSTGTRAEAWVMVMLGALTFAYIALPLAEQELGTLFRTPEIAGVRTEPILLFVGLLIVGSIVLMFYLKSRAAGPWDDSVQSSRRRRRTRTTA